MSRRVPTTIESLTYQGHTWYRKDKVSRMIRNIAEAYDDQGDTFTAKAFRQLALDIDDTEWTASEQ